MYSTAAASRHLEILQAVLLCWQAAGGAFESQHFLTAKSSAALVPMQKHLHGILQGLQLRGKVQRQCSCQTLSYWYCYSLAKPLWVDLSWIDLSFLGSPGPEVLVTCLGGNCWLGKYWTNSCIHWCRSYQMTIRLLPAPLVMTVQTGRHVIPPCQTTRFCCHNQEHRKAICSLLFA